MTEPNVDYPIHRNVILDLIPLVTAGESSRETAALVDAYLAEDPALAKLVEKMSQTGLPDAGLTPEFDVKQSEVDALERIKSLNQQRITYLSLAIGMSLLFVAFRFGEGGIVWMWRDSPQIGWPVFLTAATFWIAYLNVVWLINQE